ncbi:MAG: class I SAM-dependent methyltransferase, partial [Deltaproteobacteria bacterium]|nr:class I SAM-dependent methyltransferase [Deltaproteobacteria bacterium]
AAIERAGLELVDHFTLPDEAWWDDFYGPMEARIDELRTTHEGDDEALAILDELAGEPKMHRQCAGFYGYQFFVAQR